MALGSLTTLRVGGGLVVAAGGSMSGVDPASSPRQFARAQSPTNAPVATAFLLLARSFFVLKLNLFFDHLLDFDGCNFLQSYSKN